MQAPKSSYTKELATTNLQGGKGVSRVTIPPCRGMNQSQYDDNQSLGEKSYVSYVIGFLLVIGLSTSL